MGDIADWKNWLYYASMLPGAAVNVAEISAKLPFVGAELISDLITKKPSKEIFMKALEDITPGAWKEKVGLASLDRAHEEKMKKWGMSHAPKAFKEMGELGLEVVSPWGYGIANKALKKFKKALAPEKAKVFDQTIEEALNAKGMSRRDFNTLVGTGGVIAVLKALGLDNLFKVAPAKVVSETLTQVPIKNIEGMPLWFKPLVNKVIKEGKDVTKGYAEIDRQIVHMTTLPDGKTKVLVTQDLASGDVAVDIGLGKHGWADGHYGQPVRLEYKAAEDIMSGPSDEPFKVGVRDPLLREKVSIHEDLLKDIKPGKEGLHLRPGKTAEEFWVEEEEFTGGHPENIKFEESTIEKFGEHGSDFSKIEKYGTGKTTKESKATKELWEADWDDSLPDYEDFATGGRVSAQPPKKGPLDQGLRSLDPGVIYNEWIR